MSSPSPRGGEASAPGPPSRRPCSAALHLHSEQTSSVWLPTHPPAGTLLETPSLPPGKLLFTPQDRCKCPLLREAILDLPQGTCWTSWSRGKPPHPLPLLGSVTQEEHADPSGRVSPPMKWGVKQPLHLSPEAQPLNQALITGLLGSADRSSPLGRARGEMGFRLSCHMDSPALGSVCPGFGTRHG